MSKDVPKLIILRGNSGSGKSTVAKEIRRLSDKQLAIVEQDYLRRFVLREKEAESENNIGLILQTVNYVMSKGYHAILEGILYFPRYRAMLNELISTWPEHYVYYFDIPYQETLRRHSLKENAHEFGEKELKQWYKKRDLTGFKGEQIISENYSVEDSVARILAESEL